MLGALFACGGDNDVDRFQRSMSFNHNEVVKAFYQNNTTIFDKKHRARTSCD